MFMPRVREGEYNSFIYDSIAAGKYSEVIQFLRPRGELAPNSRAIHSVLGWCYVAQQDYVNAADCYERLTLISPENTSYWLYYAQCLKKAGFPAEAMKVVNQVASRCDPETIRILKASIRYQEEESHECKSILEKCAPKSPAVLHNQGCAHFQEKEYSDAVSKFSQAIEEGTAYSLAVAYYQLKDIRPAMKYCNEVIAHALTTNPEYLPPSQTDSEAAVVFRSSPALQDTFLIEAYNLLTALEYHAGNRAPAHLALASIPNRYEEDIDMVTLHNQAILGAEDDFEESIQMLSHIVGLPSYPKEALTNLINMYFKGDFFDMAADFMAENIEICYTQMSEEMYCLFEAIIIQQTSPEEAYIRFEELIRRYQDQLKKLSNQQKARRQEGSVERLKVVESEYDQVVSRFQTAVMSQAGMYWERKNFSQVEKQLKRFHEYLSDQLVWRTNMAHTLFMLENYQESSKFYETITRDHITQLLKITPVLLANLCVSYVMTSRNDEAEEMLHQVEEAEELAHNEPDPAALEAGPSGSSHLCLINLIVGTLYCSKGNFPFGISRVLRSFEPAVAQKLDVQTWSYVKLVFLALTYKLSQHEVVFTKEMVRECIEFLESCEDAGKNFYTGDQASGAPVFVTTVSTEARQIKRILLSYWSC